MLLKTLIAFVLAVSFAGGAVYFGLLPQTSMTGGEEVRLNNNSSPSKFDGFLKKITKQKEKFAGHSNSDDTRNTKLPRISGTKNSVKTDVSPYDVYQDKIEVLNTIMAQAGEIDMPEMKDQAYLDIVTYASKFGHYEQADAALKNIKQIELRDTARGQIAISMARVGKATEAFSVIDAVEIDSLRDVLRLQVIEAIVLPNHSASTIPQ